MEDLLLVNIKLLILLQFLIFKCYLPIFFSVCISKLLK